MARTEGCREFGATELPGNQRRCECVDPQGVLGAVCVCGACGVGDGG